MRKQEVSSEEDFADHGPRQQHYGFAHVVLPQLAHSDPEKFFGMIRGQEGRKFLLDVWESLGKGCDTKGRVNAEGLRHSLESTPGGNTVALIRLPRPERISEAYFVAPVLEPSSRRLLFFKRPATLRYFTLEYGINPIDDSELTILGEWSLAKGQGLHHLNYGEGPYPDKVLFLKAVQEFIP